MADSDRTASLMTPSKLAQVKPRGPASPAAWLDQMASDAGHSHVRRLAELRLELQSRVRLIDIAPLTAELRNLAAALPKLDFGLLQPQGWWARATGKSRSAGAEFAGQFEQIEQVAQGLIVHVQALQKKQQEQSAPVDVSLVEFEVEFHAIDKIIEQGTRWLHDMRNQLKVRETQASDQVSQQQIAADTARCEILVERLKALRAVSSAAQQSHQQAQGTAARRAALLQTLQQMVASDIRAWRSRLSTLASAASEGATAALSLEGPEEAHRELRLCIKQVTADCAQLDVHENALSDSLGALDVRLKAVAS